MRLFSDAASAVGDPFLRRAYELAERGRGTTSPNPLVGCVIVRAGEIVGEGWHERAGEPHAEVNALADAGERARGATAYVTLEPCNHTGRTGPCTSALRQAGIAAVVIGMPDPNPGVQGGGARVLREAGLEVRFAEDAAPFEEQNEAWLKRLRTGRPWVVAKVALTIDGCVALRSGARSAITGPGGAEITRRLRLAADAVMVGASTAAIDDPALTVRGADGALAVRQPLRVVLARSTAPRRDLRLFSDGLGQVAVLVPGDDTTGDAAHGATGGVTPSERPGTTARVLSYDAGEGIHGALGSLAAADVTSVLVEPGPRLFAALVEEDAIDELVVVTAGGIGGDDAVPLRPGAIARDKDAARLEVRYRPVETGIMDHDAVTVWRRRNERE